MTTWTPLDEIVTANIEYLNGDWEEIRVKAIIRSAQGLPLWLTYMKDGKEVVIFCTSIKQMTVLGRQHLIG